MGKMIDSKSGIVLGIMAVMLLALFFALRMCGEQKVVSAEVSTDEVTLGDIIEYSDQTRGASDWLWEFGNGYVSREQSGSYQFPETGSYRIRLTVDGKYEKHFTVRVKAPVVTEQQQIVRINAPYEALQGEHILFRGEGNDRHWLWEFGESGMIDSREKNAMYAYQKPGKYEVLLSTENTEYPVRHEIEIYPLYTEEEPMDQLSVIGADIREKLQNIADGKDFNPNYNYILRTYLCNNPDVVVTINNTRYNDFYSYCQGLRLIGRDVTRIETVIPESRDGGNCIDRLNVVQYNK